MSDTHVSAAPLDENPADAYLVIRRGRRRLRPLLLTVGVQLFMFGFFVVVFYGAGLPISLAVGAEALLLLALFLLYYWVGVPGYEATLELVRRADDWWLTGVGGGQLGEAVGRAVARVAKPDLFLVVGAAAFGLALAAGLAGPRGSVPFRIVEMCAFWAAGLTWGAHRSASLVPLPLTLFWATGVANGARRAVTRRGLRPAAPPTFWTRPAAWGLMFFVGAVSGMMILLMPAIYGLATLLGGTPWTAVSKARALSDMATAGQFLGWGLFVGWAWSEYARRRAPAIRGALAARFDEILELRRASRHEGKARG